MPRFYLPLALETGSDCTLPENIVRHIQVLRLKAGDELVLFDGCGTQYQAELTDLGKRHALCRILSQQQSGCESPLRLTLVQALSSGERMDFTLQKSVELGVHEIQPVVSERCVVRLAGERAAKKVERWQEIVVSACEQSGRNFVPKVLPLLSLKDYLAGASAQNSGSLRLLMSLNRAQRLHDFAPQQQVTLMIGPEGGWTAQEEQQAFDAGFQSITLGPRVLRTETASLAALAAMQALWGDF